MVNIPFLWVKSANIVYLIYVLKKEGRRLKRNRRKKKKERGG